MREPSPIDALYDWWRKALAGKAPQITHEPHAGYFKRKLVRGGPWVPARIWLHQKTDAAGELVEDERLRCQVNGVERVAEDEWLHVCDHPITRAEFEFMCADSEWAEERAPHEPSANPSKRIDFLTAPLPLFNQPRGKKP